ncbi:MAG TPA: hypothetical protein VJ770_20305, partial [Stellaceae bacterium]|nr:hypothetical protein [Stellaceae bacterium]
MSYPLGSVDPNERAAGIGAPQVRLLPRGLLPSALVLLVMTAFAGGVWFAHTLSHRHGGAAQDAPLIRAD